MRMEFLVQVRSLAAAEEVEAASGPLVHVLTPRLLLITPPDDVGVWG